MTLFEVFLSYLILLIEQLTVSHRPIVAISQFLENEGRLFSFYTTLHKTLVSTEAYFELLLCT